MPGGKFERRSIALRAVLPDRVCRIAIFELAIAFKYPILDKTLSGFVKRVPRLSIKPLLDRKCEKIRQKKKKEKRKKRATIIIWHEKGQVRDKRKGVA